MTDNGIKLGIIGELSQIVRKNFKLPDYVAAFSLDFEILQKFVSDQKDYKSLSRFPSISQDVSLRCDLKTQFNDLFSVVSECLNEVPEFHGEITPLCIYQAPDSDKKTITLRIKFTSYDKTLRDSDIKPVMENIASTALDKLNAERV